jgi:hypothetical protein
MRSWLRETALHRRLTGILRELTFHVSEAAELCRNSDTYDQAERTVKILYYKDFELRHRPFPIQSSPRPMDEELNLNQKDLLLLNGVPRLL